MINFAHGEILTVGAFGGYFTASALAAAGVLNGNAQLSILSVLVMMAVAAGTAMIVNVPVERIAYRPLRNAPRLVPLITAIGASFFMIDLIRAIEAVTRNDFHLTYPKNDLPWLTTNLPVSFGSTIVNVKPTSIIMVIGAVISLVALNWFVNGTKLGRGIRAVSQDQM